MEHEDIYNLSNRFSPPKIDLRKAQVLDDYGDDTYAKKQVNHNKPDDVKREEFDYYGWVYPFMEPEDLLFYLYAMVREYKNNKDLDCIDSFMYSMDREINGLQSILTEDENQVLKHAFSLIWGVGGDDWADWFQCKNLQQLIGISIQ